MDDIIMDDIIMDVIIMDNVSNLTIQIDIFHCIQFQIYEENRDILP